MQAKKERKLASKLVKAMIGAAVALGSVKSGSGCNDSDMYGLGFQAGNYNQGQPKNMQQIECWITGDGVVCH